METAFVTRVTLVLIRLEYFRAKEQYSTNNIKLMLLMQCPKRIDQYADSLREVSALADSKWQNEFNDITVIGLRFNLIDQLRRKLKSKVKEPNLDDRFDCLLFSFSIFVSQQASLYHQFKEQAATCRTKNLENSV
jgi:hypothetical protein